MSGSVQKVCWHAGVIHVNPGDNEVLIATAPSQGKAWFCIITVWANLTSPLDYVDMVLQHRDVSNTTNIKTQKLSLTARNQTWEYKIDIVEGESLQLVLENGFSGSVQASIFAEVIPAQGRIY